MLSLFFIKRERRDEYSHGKADPCKKSSTHDIVPGADDCDNFHMVNSSIKIFDAFDLPILCTREARLGAVARDNENMRL